LDAGEVGAGLEHVAGLGLDQLDLGGALEQLLEHADEEDGLDRAVMADVEHAGGRRGAVRRRVEQHLEQAVDDIVDVGEVAQVFPVVEELQRFPLRDRLGEEDRGHVGPAPGSVDGEEAQAGDVEAVQVGVAVGGEFVALLGRAVERQRAVGVGVLGKRRFRAGAVDAAARGVDDMLRRPAAAGLHHGGEAEEVAVHVGRGILEAVAHAGLGAEVDDVVGLEVIVEPVEGLGVGEVGLHEAERLELLELLEAGALQLDRAVVVQIVHAQHLAVLRPREARTDVVTDEPGGAGHEDFHPPCDKARRRGRLGESGRGPPLFLFRQGGSVVGAALCRDVAHPIAA